MSKTQGLPWLHRGCRARCFIYRRVRARLGPAQTTVATAQAIARVVNRMVKNKVEYDPLSVNQYQKQYEEQQIRYMKKRAAKLGCHLVLAPA